MTTKQIDQRLIDAKGADGVWDGRIIAELNDQGVRIIFNKHGVKWEYNT